MRNGLGLALVTLGSLLLSTLSSSLAHAAAGDPGEERRPAKSGTQTPDEARAEAEKRLNEGLDRYAKGDFEGARLAFAQAYAVLVSIDLLYNLTRAELKSGHPLEALVHIHQLLRNPNATTDDRAKAERLREEANRATGHVAVEAPDGAQIVLDRVPSGEAPVTETYDVVPGKHIVEVRANGSTRTIENDAPPGQLVTARFALEVARPPTAGPPVPVAAAIAPQPPHDAEPEPIEHHHHDSSARIIVPVVLGVLGIAGLGVGIGLGVASQGQESNATNFRASHEGGFCANQASTTCAQYAGILNSQQTDTNVSRVMLVSGGVLAAAAVVTFLAWPHGKERSAWVAPAPGGMVAGGTT